MIRLIQRRLIIPQGDTGTFTIPTQGSVENGDKAILAIYDKLTHQTIIEKTIDATPDTLTFEFDSNDTIISNVTNEPIEADDRGNRYSWDITILRNPVYDENDELIHCDSVDSYYAAFSLPSCVIKGVTRNVQK